MLVRYKIAMCMCSQCGGRFRSKSITASLCSDDCRKLKYVEADDNREHSPKKCGECEAIFVTSYGDKRSVFCSRICSKRHIKRAIRKKERARLRSAYVETVDPIKVFERDNWKCQECGCKAPRSLRGTYDDRAPELDHIMPLALGGAHSYLNTQCLCRRCNAAKSDTPPAQASLFAYG